MTSLTIMDYNPRQSWIQMKVIKNNGSVSLVNASINNMSKIMPLGGTFVKVGWQ